MKKAIGSAAAALVMALTNGQAQAAYSFTFDALNDFLKVNFEETYLGATLKAEITYTLTEWIDADSAKFSVSVSNLTQASQSGDNRLIGFGISVVTPNLTSISGGSTTFANIEANSNMPGGYTDVDFCGTSGNVNQPSCSGGGGGGLAEGGATDSFFVNMNFNANHNNRITFGAPYLVRYQSIGSQSGSYVFQGCPDDAPDCDRPPQVVPEPGSLALAGMALLALGAVVRRQRA